MASCGAPAILEARGTAVTVRARERATDTDTDTDTDTPRLSGRPAIRGAGDSHRRNGVCVTSPRVTCYLLLRYLLPPPARQTPAETSAHEPLSPVAAWEGQESTRHPGMLLRSESVVKAAAIFSLAIFFNWTRFLEKGFIKGQRSDTEIVDGKFIFGSCTVKWIDLIK